MHFKLEDLVSAFSGYYSLGKSNETNDCLSLHWSFTLGLWHKVVTTTSVSSFPKVHWMFILAWEFLLEEKVKWPSLLFWHKWQNSLNPFGLFWEITCGALPWVGEFNFDESSSRNPAKWELEIFLKTISLLLLLFFLAFWLSLALLVDLREVHTIEGEELASGMNKMFQRIPVLRGWLNDWGALKWDSVNSLGMDSPCCFLPIVVFSSSMDKILHCNSYSLC